VTALELGSGYAPTPGYVHLDANPNAPDVDVVGLAYPLPREIVDRVGEWTEIRAVDVLEHLSYRDVDAALRQWSNLLVTGGRLYVQVPDAEAIMIEFVDRARRGRSWSKEGQRGVDPLIAAEWRLLGGHDDGVYVGQGDDWRWNAHYSLWSRGRLTAALDRVGLDVVELTTNAHPNLCCHAVKR